MPRQHKPRSGSLGVYPRVRARKETPSLSAFTTITGPVKPLNFVGYKAGMTHVLAKNVHEKGVLFGQEVVVPVTIIECPPLVVFGIRAYEKIGTEKQPMGEIWTEKFDKVLSRKLHGLNAEKTKKSDSQKTNEKKEYSAPEKKIKTMDDFEKLKAQIVEIRLLVHTLPGKTGIGKKKPAILEVSLNGKVEEQLAYAKGKFGKEIKVNEVFKDNQMLDAHAVSKGKGIAGVIKRFGIKTFSPKAKKQRMVGSIGPWHPATVMWTVARQGQMGYHNRTEFNKKLVKIVADPKVILTPAGMLNYGNVKNEFMVIAGSVPGATKRLVAFRDAIRPSGNKNFELTNVSFPTAKGEKK